MGKRKKSSRKPQGPRKQEPLATTFSCLFCNHEKSVTCKLDKKAGIGSLSCKVCGQQFQSNINYLSAAIDVYSEWVDACDEIANPKEKNVSSSSRSGGGGVSRSQQSRGGYDGAEEDNGEDDEDDRGAYGGKAAVADDDLEDDEY